MEAFAQSEGFHKLQRNFTTIKPTQIMEKKTTTAKKATSKTKGTKAKKTTTTKTKKKGLSGVPSKINLSDNELLEIQESLFMSYYLLNKKILDLKEIMIDSVRWSPDNSRELIEKNLKEFIGKVKMNIYSDLAVKVKEYLDSKKNSQ